MKYFSAEKNITIISVLLNNYASSNRSFAKENKKQKQHGNKQKSLK